MVIAIIIRSIAHTIRNCFVYWIYLDMHFIASKLLAGLSGWVCCVHVGHCHLFGNNLCCKQRNCSPHSNYYSRCKNEKGTRKQRLYPNPQQLSKVFDSWILLACVRCVQMCPVSLERLVGSNIRCIDFGNRCPWLHLHTIQTNWIHWYLFILCCLFVLAGNSLKHKQLTLDEWSLKLYQTLHLSAWLCHSQLGLRLKLLTKG